MGPLNLLISENRRKVKLSKIVLSLIEKSLLLSILRITNQNFWIKISSN